MATMIFNCGCVVAGAITAKSAACKYDFKPKCEQTFESKLRGVEFQDARFGKGNRLHNLGGKGTEKKKRCTVCGKQTFA